MNDGSWKDHSGDKLFLKIPTAAGEKAPSLVVCPASLVYNWEQEIQKICPGSEGFRSVVGTGPRVELLEKIRSLAADLITSYDLLKRILPTMRLISNSRSLMKLST